METGVVSAGKTPQRQTQEPQLEVFSKVILCVDTNKIGRYEPVTTGQKVSLCVRTQQNSSPHNILCALRTTSMANKMKQQAKPNIWIESFILLALCATSVTTDT